MLSYLFSYNLVHSLEDFLNIFIIFHFCFNFKWFDYYAADWEASLNLQLIASSVRWLCIVCEFKTLAIRFHINNNPFAAQFTVHTFHIWKLSVSYFKHYTFSIMTVCYFSIMTACYSSIMTACYSSIMEGDSAELNLKY